MGTGVMLCACKSHFLRYRREKLDLFTLFTLSVGLSMDAFAVSICKGLAMKKATIGKAAVVGLWFGGFQALMPTLGYFFGEHNLRIKLR